MGFRSIGRILGVSNVGVRNRARAYGQKAQPLKPATTPVTAAQLDAPRSCVGSKKQQPGYGPLLMPRRKSGSVSPLGDRTSVSGGKLWQNMAARLQQAATVATDSGEAYKDLVPPQTHLHGPGTTALIERFNARLRHYLAR